MKQFEMMITVAGCITALALCGCNAGKAKGTVPISEYHGGMAHQSIYAGKRPAPTNSQAVVNLEPASGSSVRGTVLFFSEGNGVHVEGSIAGLTPGVMAFIFMKKVIVRRRTPRRPAAISIRPASRMARRTPICIIWEISATSLRMPPGWPPFPG